MKYIILALISLPVFACDRPVSKKIIDTLKQGKDVPVVRFDCVEECVCLPNDFELNTETAIQLNIDGDKASIDWERKAEYDATIIEKFHLDDKDAALKKRAMDEILQEKVDAIKAAEETP